MADFPSPTSAYGRWGVNDVRDAVMGTNWPQFPGKPTIGTATAGSGSASVTFTAPTNVGSSAITSYTVTSSPGGVTASGASSPITISGLTVGTAYTFTVRATNSQGTGPESNSSNSVTPTASNWTRILNTGGDTATSGTVSVSGYSKVLLFGVAPGGTGGGSGNDDGGGGGGGGAVQLNGYEVSIPGGVTTLYYSLPNPAGSSTTNNPGLYQSNLEVRATNSGGTLLFSLNGGQNGPCHPSNLTAVSPGGSGGAQGTYGSAAGGNGGSGNIRYPDGSGGTTGTAGSNSTVSTAGGGGGGAWVSGSAYGNTAGENGGNSTVSTTISTFGGGTVSPAFSANGTSGGTGGNGYSSTTSGASVGNANGGSNSTYSGGGGAGSGIRFFGTGSYYGGGGGGGGSQNSVGAGGGKGGAAYLVVYATT